MLKLLERAPMVQICCYVDLLARSMYVKWGPATDNLTLHVNPARDEDFHMLLRTPHSCTLATPFQNGLGMSKCF